MSTFGLYSFFHSPTVSSSPEVIVTASTSQTVDGARQTSLLVLSSGSLTVYPKAAASSALHQSFSLAECHIELVCDVGAALQGKVDSEDEQAEAGKRGGKEEVVLRVIEGKPVHGVGSTLVPGGEQRSDPLLSWRVSVPPFASPTEEAQGTA